MEDRLGAFSFASLVCLFVVCRFAATRECCRLAALLKWQWKLRWTALPGNPVLRVRRS